MAVQTRELFLDTAEALFADRGFYGVSIAAIANELGLTKQALLHHFGSKEKLYGEVLKRISARYAEMASSLDDSVLSPIERLKTYLLILFEASKTDRQQTRLLMRELLDNNQRAETAETWYLKAFLNELAEMVRAIPEWSKASEAEALALVYQLLGAINYFAISGPTLTGIFGKPRFNKLESAFPKQLEHLINAALRPQRA